MSQPQDDRPCKSVCLNAYVQVQVSLCTYVDVSWCISVCKLTCRCVSVSIHAYVLSCKTYIHSVYVHMRVSARMRACMRVSVCAGMSAGVSVCLYKSLCALASWVEWVDPNYSRR